MKIYCPMCHHENTIPEPEDEDIEPFVLTPGEVLVACPSCEQRWRVMVEFFPEDGG